MDKFLVFLANGCEDIEAITLIDYLRRADIEVDSVSIEESLDIKTRSNIIFKADKMIDHLNPDDYCGLYIPGGTQGAYSLRDNNKVIEIIKDFNKANKLIGAICAGPIVLDKAGILKDKKVTSFPSMKEELKNIGEYIDDQPLVIDGNVLTSRGAALTIYLALKIVHILKGKDVLAKVKMGIQQDAIEKYYNIESDYIKEN